MKYFAFTNFWAMVREKAIWIPLHSKKKEKKKRKLFYNELMNFIVLIESENTIWQKKVLNWIWGLLNVLILKKIRFAYFTNFRKIVCFPSLLSGLSLLKVLLPCIQEFLLYTVWKLRNFTATIFPQIFREINFLLKNLF